MNTVKGSKKEGAVIRFTKTWGYQVIDYVNLSTDGRPCSYNAETLDSAERQFNNILHSKTIRDNAASLRRTESGERIITAQETTIAYLSGAIQSLISSRNAEDDLQKVMKINGKIDVLWNAKRIIEGGGK